MLLNSEVGWLLNSKLDFFLLNSKYDFYSSSSLKVSAKTIFLRVHIYDLHINKYTPICVQAVVPKKRVCLFSTQLYLSFDIVVGNFVFFLLSPCDCYKYTVQLICSESIKNLVMSNSTFSLLDVIFLNVLVWLS